jgi:hypothetical protein
MALRRQWCLPCAMRPTEHKPEQRLGLAAGGVAHAFFKNPFKAVRRVAAIQRICEQAPHGFRVVG